MKILKKIFNKNKVDNKPNIKNGDIIEIIECPRLGDNADAFKGYTGRVVEYTDWGFTIMAGTSSLVIPKKYYERLKIKMIKEY